MPCRARLRDDWPFYFRKRRRWCHGQDWRGQDWRGGRRFFTSTSVQGNTMSALVRRRRSGTPRALLERRFYGSPRASVLHRHPRGFLDPDRPTRFGENNAIRSSSRFGGGKRITAQPEALRMLLVFRIRKHRRRSWLTSHQFPPMSQSGGRGMRRLRCVWIRRSRRLNSQYQSSVIMTHPSFSACHKGRILESPMDFTTQE
jgi:hypothetical protein